MFRQFKEDRRFKILRRIVLVCFLTVCLMFSVVGTIGTSEAFLAALTGKTVNTFRYGEVSCEIHEKFNGQMKSNVQVKNTGNIPAYIRAAVIITWQDEYGNVYWKKPAAGSDYVLAIGSDWTKSGDYYYWPSPVTPDAYTGVLITSCTKGSAPEGYHLVVDIAAEAIQSQPTSAAQEAWGITFAEGGGIQ